MKEDILFAIMKDKPLENSKKIKEKYHDINCAELRLMIINYQIDKYGYQLTKIDNNKTNRNARQRIYAKKKYWREK